MRWPFIPSPGRAGIRREHPSLDSTFADYTRGGLGKVTVSISSHQMGLLQARLPPLSMTTTRNHAALLLQQPALLELGEVEARVRDGAAVPQHGARGAAQHGDGVDRRAGDRDLLAVHLDRVDLRPHARIIKALLQAREQRVGIEAFGLHMHPAAEMVGRLEMRVVGGECGEALSFGQQLVGEVPAVAAVVLDGAAMIVDLHRMRAVDGAAVLDGELRPCGMRNADEGAGLMRAARHLRSRLAIEVAREVQRQARRHDVPELAHAGFRRMELRADQRREVVGAEVARVGDGKIEIADEMFGQLHEVIARALVGIDHRPGLQRAVGEVGMRMQVSAPEAAGGGEGGEQGHAVFLCWGQTLICMPSSTTRSGGMRKNSMARADWLAIMMKMRCCQ